MSVESPVRRPSVAAQLAQSFTHRPPGAPPKAPKDRPNGTTKSSSRFGFNKSKPEPQSRFVEMFGDGYNMDKANAAAPVVENLAPDSSPPPKPKRKPKPKAQSASPPSAPPTLPPVPHISFDESSEGAPKAPTSDAGTSPPTTAVAESTDLQRSPSTLRRKSSISRLLSSEPAEPAKPKTITFDDLSGAYTDRSAVKTEQGADLRRRSSLSRMISREDTGQPKAAQPKAAFAELTVDQLANAYKDRSPSRQEADGENPLRRSISLSRRLSLKRSPDEPEAENAPRRSLSLSSDEGGASGQASYRQASLIRAFSGKGGDTGGANVKPSNSIRRQSFIPLGNNPGDLEFHDLARKSSREAAPSGVTRRQSFIPLGNNPGELEFHDLGRKSSREAGGGGGGGGLGRRLSLSRTKSNAEPRTIGFEDLAGEPQLVRKSSTAQPSTGRRISVAPLGASVGELDFNRLQRKSSRDAGAESRTITFDDLAGEPQLARKQSVKPDGPADGGRRRSFAPLGSTVGQLDLSGLGRRQSTQGGGAQLSRTKSNEPRTIGFEDLAAEPQPALKRKTSIKFAPANDASNDGRRRSIGVFGLPAADFDINDLQRVKSRDSQTGGGGGGGGLGRRLSLSRTRSNEPPPATIGFEELSAQPYIERTASNDPGRRRSIAPGDDASGGVGFNQLARKTSRDLGRRLSFKAGDDAYLTGADQSPTTVAPDSRRRSIALFTGNVGPIDFDRKPGGGGGGILLRRLSRTQAKPDTGSRFVEHEADPERPSMDTRSDEGYSTPPEQEQELQTPATETTEEEEEQEGNVPTAAGQDVEPTVGVLDTSAQPQAAHVPNGDSHGAGTDEEHDAAASTGLASGLAVGAIGGGITEAAKSEASPKTAPTPQGVSVAYEPKC